MRTTMIAVAVCVLGGCYGSAEMPVVLPQVVHLDEVDAACTGEGMARASGQLAASACTDAIETDEVCWTSEPRTTNGLEVVDVTWPDGATNEVQAVQVRHGGWFGHPVCVPRQ